MLCKDLTEGMLVKITNPTSKGWFNHKAQERLLKEFDTIPPKFVIGPDVVSLIMRLDGISKFINAEEMFVYLGKHKLKAKSGSIKTVRLVFAKGTIGFIEGRDVKYIEPA